MAAKMLEAGVPNARGCAALLDKIGHDCGNLKVPRAKDGCGILLGAYVHGGAFGVTSLGKELKWTTMYFNKFLSKKLKQTFRAQDGGEFTWATLALQHASEVPMHRDVHNQRGSKNYVIEIKCDEYAGLWVQDDHDDRGVQGGTQAVDHQWQAEDGTIHNGCLVDIKKKPAAFSPRLTHGYIKDTGARWFLSAYTPHGVHRLSEADKTYLEGCGFPLPEPQVRAEEAVLETIPALKATSFPQDYKLDGVRFPPDDVEDLNIARDDDEACGDWGIYVEEEVQGAGDGNMLRKICDSDGPGNEAELLWRTSQSILGLNTDATYQEDLAACAEEWVGEDGCLNPRVAKLEPEYTPNIEEVIKELIDNDTPLRHTHNVSPQEVRQVLPKWKASIEKELGVVEKGFRRSTVKEIRELKATRKVQELPAKVYTVKPPANDGTITGEAKYCKRKADIFASGAAAESLTFSAWSRWFTGLLDIAGAFMLTPLPQGPDEVVYAVQPPAVLVKLGLASEDERWILTHGMYGLRQSPRLWSEFRDQTIKEMRFMAEDAEWMLKQGDAEPNLWFLGCEILTTEAPRHLVTFEAEPDEPKGDEQEIKLAQRLCGELLWLAQRTRPDVSFTVNAMGALISRAAPRCIAIGVRLLSYLQHTQEYALTIAPTSDGLITFTDSSYAPEGKRSHSGILVTWRGAPLSWRATRTPYVCLSTAESELTAAIEGLKMTMSLGAVLEELVGVDLPIQLAVDNQSAIAIAKPTGSTSWRTRHLRVRSAFIREQVQNNKVQIRYVKGQQQLADLLTKSFPRQRLEELVVMWGIGRLTEGAKTTMLRAMILCTMIQSARAQEPLALDTMSIELYAFKVNQEDSQASFPYVNFEDTGYVTSQSNAPDYI
ncbi:GIP [Symbiodinium sp. CCMP2456]|nr:GIP [Symbiodinium sp. CCMP2456]